MKSLKHLTFGLIFAALTVIGSPLKADTLRVVTTLSVYADIAKTIGAERVETAYIASPRFNPHFIEPRPSDVLKVKRADLFIHSGLDLEAWRDPLLNAAARADVRVGGERTLDISARIPLLEVPNGPISRAEGDIHLFGNPHYWLDPRNGKIIAEEIEAKLAALDPAGAAIYAANLAAFSVELDKKISQWSAEIAPYQGYELIGYHNEWIYLISFLGLKMDKFLEPKPGIPPTPAQVELITTHIRANQIRGIVQASYNPREASDTVAERTGSQVLMLCQNVGELDAANSYIATIDYDIARILEALKRK